MTIQPGSIYWCIQPTPWTPPQAPGTPPQAGKPCPPWRGYVLPMADGSLQAWRLKEDGTADDSKDAQTTVDAKDLFHDRESARDAYILEMQMYIDLKYEEVRQAQRELADFVREGMSHS